MLKPIAGKTIPILLLGCLMLPMGIHSLAEDSDDATEEKIERAIHNEAVREYFRRQFNDFNTAVDRWGRRREIDLFPVEDQVDRMSRVFLKKVLSELEALEAAFQVEQEARLDVEQSVETSKKSRKAQVKAWRISLRSLGKAAKDLRGTIRPILSAVHRRSMNKNARHSLDLRQPEEREKGLETLETEAAEAIRGVDGFFFGSSFTVSLDELTGNDLLVILDRVERLADDLAERVG